MSNYHIKAQGSIGATDYGRIYRYSLTKLTVETADRKKLTIGCFSQRSVYVKDESSMGLSAYAPAISDLLKAFDILDF